ncbi:hypothetical protein CDCA_CDCA01G0086 [Cyanidium caldarium]|uniref:TOG domain-containing protein n=1 Tax=Cyanidium caldarium TaxID=2771 RepID=A0AAV9IPR9_CYACA|nr:hypothetical protein CDCA_CDCA01G0086 [Cyanidium caldarium]
MEPEEALLEQARSLSFPERVSHKLWRAREAALRERAEAWTRQGEAVAPEDGPLLATAVRDANAAVQLAALDAVVALSGAAPEVAKRPGVARAIAKAVPERCFTGRPQNRNRAMEAALALAGAGTVAEVIEGLMEGGYRHRLPKVVAACLECVRQCVERHREAVPDALISRDLPRLLEHSSQEVRNAAKALQSLADAAPAAASAPSTPADASTAPSDTSLLIGVEDDDGNSVSLDFYTALAHPKWKVRKVALDRALERPPAPLERLTAELPRILATEANITVVTAAAKLTAAIASHTPHGRALAAAALTRLKEKNRGMLDALVGALNALADHRSVSVDQVATEIADLSTNKVPAARMLALQWCARLLRLASAPQVKAVVRPLKTALAKRIHDASVEVRDAALECVSLLLSHLGEPAVASLLEGMDKIKLGKIRQMHPPAEKPEPPPEKTERSTPQRSPEPSPRQPQPPQPRRKPPQRTPQQRAPAQAPAQSGQQASPPPPPPESPAAVTPDENTFQLDPTFAQKEKHLEQLLAEAKRIAAQVTPAPQRPRVVELLLGAEAATAERIDATKQISATLKEAQHATLVPHATDLCVALVGGIRQGLQPEAPPEDGMRSVKYHLNALMHLVMTPEMASALELRALEALVDEVLERLLDARVPSLPEGHQVLRAYNLLMLKTLEHAARVEMYRALVRALRTTLRDHHQPSTAERSALLVKCLHKLVSYGGWERATDANGALELLFYDMHLLFTSGAALPTAVTAPALAAVRSALLHWTRTLGHAKTRALLRLVPVEAHPYLVRLVEAAHADPTADADALQCIPLVRNPDESQRVPWSHLVAQRVTQRPTPDAPPSSSASTTTDSSVSSLRERLARIRSLRQQE